MDTRQTETPDIAVTELNGPKVTNIARKSTTDNANEACAQARCRGVRSTAPSLTEK